MDPADLVRQAHDRLNEGDIDGLVALCSPDFHLDMSERVFNPETFHGHDGLRAFYAEVREVWDEFRWEAERIEVMGERIVAVVHTTGRGRSSGLEIDRRVAFAWTVRDERAVSLRMHVDLTQALEAV